MTDPQPEPGLCLVASAEAGAGWLARLRAALAATKAQTLILTAPEGAAFDTGVTRPLVEMSQGMGIATLLADDVEAARSVHADGVHLTSRPDIEEAYAAARATLGDRAIVGVDAGGSRHDAMTLGDAGADYIAFSRSVGTDGSATFPATQQALVAWWSDLFVVPVVAFDVEAPAEASAVIHSGADFIAVRFPHAAPEKDDTAWAAALIAALGSPAGAA